jgi:hypothetical protein
MSWQKYRAKGHHSAWERSVQCRPGLQQPHAPDRESACLSTALAAASLGLFGLFALVSRLSPAWLKRYKLEIYENGFVKKDLFKTRACLWGEIREVKPRMLVYDKASLNTPPGEFGNLGEDTQERGVYEVYRKGGGKITVSRR